MDNIIELAVSTFQCPDALKSKEKKIASIHDCLVWTLDKHKVVGEAITAGSTGEGLKEQIGDFYYKFGARNECDTVAETEDAAAVATILTIANISPATHILVQKTMLYGVGLAQEQLETAAQDLAAGKQLGDRSATTEDLERVHYMGMLELVTAAVCQVDSESGGAACAIWNLFHMDISECQRIIDALAVERRAWEAAYRELGEKPMATYMRIENFKSNIEKCNQFSSTVQEFEFITSHRQDIRLSKIREWENVERLFVEAAIIANRQENSMRVDIADDSSMSSGDSGGVSVHTAAHTGHRHRTGRNLLQRKSELPSEVLRKDIKELEENGKDIGLKCKSCDAEFMHSVKQQVRFMVRGWTNLPGKCPGCVDKDLKENPQPCFDFNSTGTCRFGDQCKFIHDKKEDEKTEVHHAYMDEEDESDSDSIDLNCYWTYLHGQV